MEGNNSGGLDEGKTVEVVSGYMWKYSKGKVLRVLGRLELICEENKVKVNSKSLD